MFKQTSLFIFVVLVILAGCSRGSSSYSSAPMTRYSEAEYQETTVSNENTEALAVDVNNSQDRAVRRLITRSDLLIMVENLEESIKELNTLMNKYGAFAASIYVYGNSREYVLRIPSIYHGNFLEELMETGAIVSYNETTEDVTLQYYDLESRLNTRRELISTFQGYISRATNMQEILMLETRIADLQREIDDVGRQFRRMNDLIDYSTVKLELIKQMETVAAPQNDTLLDRIKGVMSGFGSYVSTIAVILFSIIIYGVPTIIIILFLYWLLFGRIGIIKKVIGFVTEKKSD
jgi:hypothetical protein